MPASMGPYRWITLSGQLSTVLMEAMAAAPCWELRTYLRVKSQRGPGARMRTDHEYEGMRSTIECVSLKQNCSDLGCAALAEEAFVDQ